MATPASELASDLQANSQTAKSANPKGQDTSTKPTKVLKKGTTKAKSKQKSRPIEGGDRQRETIQYNPLIDTGANIIIPEAKAQRERWQKIMGEVFKSPDFGVMVWERSLLSAAGDESILSSTKDDGKSLGILSTKEWDTKGNIHLHSAMIERILSNLSATEIASTIQREALTVFSPLLRANLEKHEIDCQKAGDSVMKMLHEAVFDLQLQKQFCDSQAEILAARIQIQWFETAKKKWINDDKLHKVLGVIKDDPPSIYITSRQLTYYISRYIARYFAGRKAEYDQGKLRIEKNLAMVKERIKSVSVSNPGDVAYQCQCAITVMGFDYRLYQATFTEDLEINSASILPPMDLDLK